ncbi:hypothetical protein HHK36_007204 [Tetracentron sinense]|uniref:Uncharacterized protein n=1 Tax=Tetracentron sinense TaxID=13715 RepID=A0A835DL13_TETSI|nr:hypothetical protein HHK36_007204 [Tetracentron sinense]
MLGSLDCMHWEWKNCPTAWHGTHRGHHHNPTLRLEAVASKDLWIWHAFFGMPSSHNDATLMQTIAHPTMGKERLFAKKQEVVRKDVERAFGVLQIRWRPPPDETISPLEYARNPAILVAHISSQLSKIRNGGTNTMLRFDLMEHLWNKFGDEAV